MSQTMDDIALGFLTVWEHAEQGLFGGLLVVNRTGRPLEFHCTAPVRVSRSQQILFGPTLKPYLYGEQLAKSLVERASASSQSHGPGRGRTAGPDLLLTDVPLMLTVRPHVQQPVALVSPTGEGDPRCGEPAVGKLVWFALGGQHLAVAARWGADRQVIEQRLDALGELFDLTEPFGRIHQAIEEAHRDASLRRAA
jgi:hypothetical protein